MVGWYYEQAGPVGRQVDRPCHIPTVSCRTNRILQKVIFFIFFEFDVGLFSAYFGLRCSCSYKHPLTYLGRSYDTLKVSLRQIFPASSS